MTNGSRILICTLVLLAGGKLIAGVRQTNVGTNAYRDMQNVNNYAPTVNPNYSDRGTVYHGENGAVAVGPRGAVVATDNGTTAVYNGYNAVVTGGYYYDYNGWSSTAAPGAAIPVGTIVENVPSTATPVMVGGTRYYYYAEYNTFLSEVYDGYGIVYEIVPPPIGAVITMLPPGCAVQYINGKSFSVCGTTYYQQVAGGYEIVR
ncbi:MAG: hypothetical protein C5B54_10540 [Acidobacteria bacterium]|nr:MAG: hypothetical protein C5B54_10540 [Acidobacteriota bacterium]